MVKALTVRKQREAEVPRPAGPAPRGAQALGWCVRFCADAHHPVCVHRYIFTHGALNSCLALSAAGPAQAQVGVGAIQRSLSPAPCLQATPTHVARAPCAPGSGLSSNLACFLSLPMGLLSSLVTFFSGPSTPSRFWHQAQGRGVFLPSKSSLRRWVQHGPLGAQPLPQEASQVSFGRVSR